MELPVGFKIKAPAPPGGREVQYTVEKRLGAGAAGTVYRVHDDSKNNYAMKVFYLPPEIEDKKARDDVENLFFTEAAAQQLISSTSSQCQTNIVCLYNSFILDRSDGSSLAILIYELMDGDIFDFPPDQTDFLYAMRCLLEALVYIHSEDFAHRDIKLENALRRGHVYKLGDLGFLCVSGARAAKSKDDPVNNIPTCNYDAFTLTYLPPEAMRYIKLFGTEPDKMENQKAADVYALGIVFFEILFGKEPFDVSGNDDDFIQRMMALDQSDLTNTIMNAKPRFDIPEGLLTELKKLIIDMTQLDFTKRPTAKDALARFDKIVPLSLPPISALGPLPPIPSVSSVPLIPPAPAQGVSSVPQFPPPRASVSAPADLTAWRPGTFYDLDTQRLMSARELVRNIEAKLLEPQRLEYYKQIIDSYANASPEMIDRDHLREILQQVEDHLSILKTQGLQAQIPYTEALRDGIKEILVQ